MDLGREWVVNSTSVGYQTVNVLLNTALYWLYSHVDLPMGI